MLAGVVDPIVLGSLGSPDGAGRHQVTLVPLQSAALSVTTSTLGAALHAVEAIAADGRRTPLVLSLPTVADLTSPARDLYLGVTCGRYANRIARASYRLDGTVVRLAANEGSTHLHGGPDGFDRRIWDLTEVVDHHDGGRVVMSLTSPEGDQGYPGTLRATASYELSGHRLTIAYEATADAPTVVNLTNHAYWNLGGPDRWSVERSIGDHELCVPGRRVLPVDHAGIPSGPLVAVAGTPFDLRSPVGLDEIFGRVGSGLDHGYEVPEQHEAPDGGDGLHLAAVVHHPPTGRTLTVRTDQPSVQVYTAGGLGLPFAPSAAICLETQRFPDTPNRPELGSAVLRPGERYRSTTELTIGTT